MTKKGESEKKPFCNCVSVIVTHLGDYSEKCYQVTDGQAGKVLYQSQLSIVRTSSVKGEHIILLYGL